MTDPEDPKQAILQMIRAMLQIGYTGAFSSDPDHFQSAVDAFIGEIQARPDMPRWTVAETQSKFEQWYAGAAP